MLPPVGARCLSGCRNIHATEGRSLPRGPVELGNFLQSILQLFEDLRWTGDNQQQQLPTRALTPQSKKRHASHNLGCALWKDEHRGEEGREDPRQDGADAPQAVDQQ